MVRASHRGFSLIEVIIAVAILGISLLGIVPLLVSSVSVNRAVSIEAEAQRLAAERLQELQTWPESQITNATCYNTNNWCSDGTVATFYGVPITRQYRFSNMQLGAGTTRPASYLIFVMVTYTEDNTTRAKVYTTTWLRP